MNLNNRNYLELNIRLKISGLIIMDENTDRPFRAHDPMYVFGPKFYLGLIQSAPSALFQKIKDKKCYLIGLGKAKITKSNFIKAQNEI